MPSTKKSPEQELVESLGTNPTEPGVYSGMPFEDYQLIPAVNQTALKRMARSPAHARAANFEPTTAAKTLGDAIHVGILEQDRFLEKYVPIEEDGITLSTGKNLKIWKDAVKRAAEEHPGKIPVHPRDMVVIRGLWLSVRRVPLLVKALEDHSQTELTLVWDEPTHNGNLRCKARIDLWCPDGTRVDIKSCVSAAPGAFTRNSAAYGYVFQDAFYGMGMRALGLADRASYIAACEKASPWGVALYQHGEDDLDKAETRLYHWINEYAQCQERNEWPGYSTQPETLEIPSWLWEGDVGADDSDPFEGM